MNSFDEINFSETVESINHSEEELDSYEPTAYHDQDLRILKAITTDNKLAIDFINNNDPNFFLGDAKPVGKVIYDYIKQYKTAPTKRILLDKHSKNNDLSEKIENVFERLNDIEFNANEYKYDVEKIRQTYAQTKFASLKDDLRFHNDNDNMESAVKKMEQTLKEIKKAKEPEKKTYTQKSLDEHLPEFHQEYIKKLENPDYGKGILTGYSYIDYITNGMRPGEFFIISGETGQGKSVWLTNMALNMWRQKNTIFTDPSEYTEGCNIIYFSLELSYAMSYNRFIAALSDIPLYGIRDANLTKSQTELLNLSSKFIKKYSQKAKFEVIDVPRGLDIYQLEDRFVEAKQKFNNDLPTAVFIDYLGLMSDDEEGGDDWLKLGKLSGKVHEFGRANEVFVASAVQLNRLPQAKANSEQNAVGLHRVGRSSLVAHNTDMFLQIETRKSEEKRDTMMNHILKSRSGTLGKFELGKNFANGSIYDIPYVPPEVEENNMYISGFDDEEDISKQVKELLGL